MEKTKVRIQAGYLGISGQYQEKVKTFISEHPLSDLQLSKKVKQFIEESFPEYTNRNKVEIGKVYPGGFGVIIPYCKKGTQLSNFQYTFKEI